MSYQALHDRFKRIGDLNHALAMLAWDEAAMMPVGGGKARAESLATLTGMVHDLTGAPATGELVEAAAADSLDPWQAANVEQVRREWRRARAVPTELEMALSIATSECEQAWRPARGRQRLASRGRKTRDRHRADPGEGRRTRGCVGDVALRRFAR